MGSKNSDARLLCRSMMHDGECVERGAIVEILVGADLEKVRAALQAKGLDMDVPEGHLVVRYVDGTVRDIALHDRAVALLGFWPFRHEAETLMPLNRDAAWLVAQARWAGY